jgi:hypothetical protein
MGEAMPTFTKLAAPAALAVLVPLVFAGCAASDSLSDEDENGGDEALVQENANDKTAFDFFVGKGLTKDQAAGIVGNRGIAQWSAGGRWDHDFHDNVVWYANEQGESAVSLHLQLEFIWYELTQIGYGYSALRHASTVTSATEVFQDDYEICGACDSSNRIAHAEAALADFGHDGGGGGGCVDGGYYCGGDKVSGNSSTLYRCNGGSAPTVVEHCGNGCEVRSGEDDVCRSGGNCVVGGYYCGGDKVSGSAGTLYRCTGGSSGTVVRHCADGCDVRPGEDDACH